MHIPPYHKKPSWQRFLAGAAIGSVLSYCLLMYMYGYQYEKLIAENYELQAEVTKLKAQNEALLKDKEDLSEKSNQSLTVQAIEVEITNGTELKLDRLITFQLEEMMKAAIHSIIGEPINVVAGSEELLVSTIENKGFTVDDFTYYFDITRLTMISQTVKITVKTKLSGD
ncbi:hypothetical protein CV093_13175 [Oceanobacillus sp. 143]|jgi:hypothetical protein|uniref:Sporulation membrane protein YtrI C-terminal domain-containing protein n=1 Tax=Oceanobacillus zhaokaii TaxID=2052660 RepID=A0A345PI47_9BACI|nr:sporulation membrane protein YtrI [Oceanobacillus zhaokaii]AXI09677.1 hypothetical protein CUC15_12420 [Oceanobacillus zhaokaii]QGS69009.1 hypothetical protein CV093_13175 [Oceanobacillus sp. 143]